MLSSYIHSSCACSVVMAARMAYIQIDTSCGMVDFVCDGTTKPPVFLGGLAPIFCLRIFIYCRAACEMAVREFWAPGLTLWLFDWLSGLSDGSIRLRWCRKEGETLVANMRKPPRIRQQQIGKTLGKWKTRIKRVMTMLLAEQMFGWQCSTFWFLIQGHWLVDAIANGYSSGFGWVTWTEW